MELALRTADAPTLDNLQEWVAGQLSPQTRRAYQTDLSHFVGFMGTPDLSAVRREDIYRYRARLVEQGYAPATVNRRMSAVRQLFGEAVRHGLIDSNPAEGVKGYKSEGNYSTTKCPTEDQVRALLNSLEGDSPLDRRDRAMVYLTATLGLRRDEVTRLTVDSLVEDQGVWCLEIRGKGNKRRREAIPDSALIAVRQWIEAAGLEGQSPLFPSITKNGGWHIGTAPMTGNGVWYVLSRRMQAVGIEGCSPHSLRHFAITYLLTHGMELWRVQRLAGHSDPSTTQRYNQARQDHDNSARRYVRF